MPVLPAFVAEDLRGRARLFDALGRDVAMEAFGQQAARLAVFQPIQQLAQDAKGRRHQAAGIARVHAFAQDLDLERPGDVAA